MYKLTHKHENNHGMMRHVFTASLFFFFHFAFVTYTNSSFIEQVSSKNLVGIFYALGGIVTIILFLFMPEITKKYGAYKTLILLSVNELIFLSILAFAEDPILIGGAFVLHHAVNPLIFLCLDVGVEELSEKKSMGKVRGLFLTVISLAYVISPFSTGTLVEKFGIQSVYAISLIFMTIFTLFCFKYFKKIPEGKYKKINPKSEIKEFMDNKNIRNIGLINLILHFFYAIMVIYTPIYLHSVLGFNWGEIGLILSIALVPFVIFEAPIGELADKKYGEKEFIIAGIIFLAITVMFIPFGKTTDFVFWAILLFFSRIGASMLETASDTYFFKKTVGKDELIGIYRMTSPLAFVIGPTIASIIIQFGIDKIFFLLSIILVLGLVPAFRIKDTL